MHFLFGHNASPVLGVPVLCCSVWAQRRKISRPTFTPTTRERPWNTFEQLSPYLSSLEPSPLPYRVPSYTPLDLAPACTGPTSAGGRHTNTRPPPLRLLLLSCTSTTLLISLPVCS